VGELLGRCHDQRRRGSAPPGPRLTDGGKAPARECLRFLPRGHWSAAEYPQGLGRDEPKEAQEHPAQTSAHLSLIVSSSGRREWLGCGGPRVHRWSSSASLDRMNTNLFGEAMIPTISLTGANGLTWPWIITIGQPSQKRNPAKKARGHSRDYLTGLGGFPIMRSL